MADSMSRSTATGVGEVIRDIVAAYYSDWDKTKLKFAKEFLARTWAGIPLPVLSMCGQGTQEIRYSTYLAYFLDYAKPHGLNTRYLDSMLSFLGFSDVDTYKSIVETEKWIGQIENEKGSYPDIVITTKTHSIVIEQKITSGESKNATSGVTQLIRYDRAISQNPIFTDKTMIRIFLTPTGKKSAKSPHWIPLSHKDLITIGMHTLSAGGLSGIARENLKRFLLDLCLGPYKQEEKRIQDLIESAEQAVTSTNFADKLRFDQYLSSNQLLVELLMEG